ncbi:hypothetical protein BGZ95_008705, partial [Linnemannia exigua]
MSTTNNIFDNGAARRAFIRHSSTLRRLAFLDTFIGSKDLLAILELCGSLEMLIQTGRVGIPHITLADAISVPWACKKIRRLEITIGLTK